jgi:predicted DsbA family dithiol-disulfide isomerase
MTVSIAHYSDILCVWAYIAQIRIDQLREEFAADIELDYHFCQVFGDTATKIGQGWQDRGGFQAYSRHVLSLHEKYSHVAIHPEIWTRNVPHSSLPIHLALRAADLVLEEEGRPDRADVFAALIWRMRTAFFVDLIDIGQHSCQLEVMEELNLAPALVEAKMNNGEAFARLSRDFERTLTNHINVSPTLLFNEGRQHLIGNVGFRIIEANVRELLRHSTAELSWC